MYLADRAEMLANLIYCNIHDTTDAGGDGSSILYTDIRADAEDLSISSGKRQTLLDQARYTFGSNENDTLAGTGNADHLYGMGGDDELQGYAGNDYLEGGSGNDKLDGGIGKRGRIYLLTPPSFQDVFSRCWQQIELSGFVANELSAFALRGEWPQAAFCSCCFLQVPSRW